jgi:hypothetical protein
MTDEMTLWHTFRAATQANAAQSTPATREAARAAHAAWVRVYCPADAAREIAAYAERMEVDCAA